MTASSATAATASIRPPSPRADGSRVSDTDCHHGSRFQSRQSASETAMAGARAWSAVARTRIRGVRAPARMCARCRRSRSGSRRHLEQPGFRSRRTPCSCRWLPVSLIAQARRPSEPGLAEEGRHASQMQRLDRRASAPRAACAAAALLARSLRARVGTKSGSAVWQAAHLPVELRRSSARCSSPCRLRWFPPARWRRADRSGSFVSCCERRADAVDLLDQLRPRKRWH